MDTLYYAPGTCAVACWISLAWAGADYRVERVDPHAESYRKINPLGLVPALAFGGSRPMTEVDAILGDIADRHPAANLGADAGREAVFLFRETLSFLSSDMHPAFWPFFAPQRYTTSTDPTALDAVREASHARVDVAMTHLDSLIGSSNHVYHDRRSVADALAFVMARWTARFPKAWKDYPNVARFMAAMQADPVVTRVLEESTRK